MSVLRVSVGIMGTTAGNRNVAIIVVVVVVGSFVVLAAGLYTYKVINKRRRESEVVPSPASATAVVPSPGQVAVSNV